MTVPGPFKNESDTVFAFPLVGSEALTFNASNWFEMGVKGETYDLSNLREYYQLHDRFTPLPGQFSRVC